MLIFYKRDHKLLTWLLSSTYPHSPRATSINLVDLLVFRMCSQIDFQLSFYLLRIQISSFLVPALSCPTYQFSFNMFSSFPLLSLLISVSKGLNEMTIYTFLSKLGHFQEWKRTILKIALRQQAYTKTVTGSLSLYIITLKWSKVRRLREKFHDILGPGN